MSFSDWANASRSEEERQRLLQNKILEQSIEAIDRFWREKNEEDIVFAARCVRNLCVEKQGREKMRECNAFSIIIPILSEIFSDSSRDPIPAPSKTAVSLLQVLANAISASEAKNQEIVWELCFPRVFSNILTHASDDSVSEIVSNIVYSCCLEDQSRRDQLLSEREILCQLVMASARAPPGHRIHQWIDFLLLKLMKDENGLLRILDAAASPPPSPAAVAVFQILEEIVQEKFAQTPNDDPANIPPLTDFEGRGGGCEGSKKLVQIFVDFAKEFTAEGGGGVKLEEKTETPAFRILSHSLRILSTITGIWDESTVRCAVQGGGGLPVAIAMLRLLQPSVEELERRRNESKKMGLADVKEPLSERARFNIGLRRDLVRLVANTCHGNREAQDEVRECGGLVSILNATNIDEENPYIQQWSVWAIRNLTENNLENQQVIHELEAKQVVSAPAELERMGLQATLDEETGVIKFKTRAAAPPSE